MACYKAQNEGIAAVAATVEVPTGEVWRTLLIQAEFNCDANVATRNCNLRIPETGLGNVRASSPSTRFVDSMIQLTASQVGGIIVNAEGSNYSMEDINGTIGQGTLYWRVPWLSPGADIFGDITANPQAADEQGIYVLYEKHTLRT